MYFNFWTSSKIYKSLFFKKEFDVCTYDNQIKLKYSSTQAFILFVCIKCPVVILEC